jgi:hypothetical protein
LVLRLFSTVLSRVLQRKGCKVVEFIITVKVRDRGEEVRRCRGYEDKELKLEEFEASHTLASHTLAGEGGIQGEGRGEEARGLGRGGEGVQIFLTTQTRTLSASSACLAVRTHPKIKTWEDRFAAVVTDEG